MSGTETGGPVGGETVGEETVGEEPVGAASVTAPPGPAAPCPACGEEIVPGDLFCESCGFELTTDPAAGPALSPGPAAVPPGGPDNPDARTGEVRRMRMADPEPSAPTAPVPVRACPACGGSIAEDGYCEVCGAKAGSERDHFVEAPTAWVAGMCDRGVRHHRNEDAMALCAEDEPGSFAVLVVCDGVSSSTDSDVASLAAARAARDVLCGSPPDGGMAARVSAWSERLVTATAAANDVATATATPNMPNPPSCTFVAAVVQGPLIVVGCVGDSRAYWLADAGEAVPLSRDDSWAADQIAQGVPRSVAEADKQAHAITAWLGADADHPVPTITSWQPEGAGWVLVCSDGLWNYCSEAADLSALLMSFAHRGEGPPEIAASLTAWANAQGGHDNITVALARLGSPGA